MFKIKNLSANAWIVRDMNVQGIRTTYSYAVASEFHPDEIGAIIKAWSNTTTYEPRFFFQAV